jgi:tellurite resistance protein TehA-like permease
MLSWQAVSLLKPPSNIIGSNIVRYATARRTTRMLAAIFVLVCAGWGLLIGTLMATVLRSLRRLAELTAPNFSKTLIGCAYWILALAILMTLHFHYVSDDDIGRHVLATAGFYIGAAVPFAMDAQRIRGILRYIR